MSDQDAITPRIVLMRHGETEWAKIGRFTGTTDIELTPAGQRQISSMAEITVGPGKPIDPSRLTHVFVSPRKRAVQTFQLLLPDGQTQYKTTFTEDIAEWDYGSYEGLTMSETVELRKQKGLDQGRQWDIRRDGCEGGETMEQVTWRLDNLISTIRSIQQPYMKGERPADVLIVAHGLIIRCFLKRWLNFAVDFELPMMQAPGAITVLSYKNGNANKPAFYLGLALP